MRYSLEKIQRTYKQWGKHPWAYRFACILTFLGREQKLRRRAAELLGLDFGDMALDLACGTGLNFGHLEKKVGEGGKVIGFDYSDKMLNAARERARHKRWGNVELMQGDAADMILDVPVDGVISTLGVSAIPRHTEALRRSADALKPGGSIVILDARLPCGVWRVFNPLVKAVYRFGAQWDWTKDIVGDLKEIFGEVNVEEYNGGTIFIAYAIKH